MLVCRVFIAVIPHVHLAKYVLQWHVPACLIPVSLCRARLAPLGNPLGSAILSKAWMKAMLTLCNAAADKYKHLSSAGIRGVIAGGIIGIICIAALALIMKDLRGARNAKVRM